MRLTEFLAGKRGHSPEFINYVEKKKQQPEKCQRCEWGRWDGTSQFCMLPACWKRPPD